MSKRILFFILFSWLASAAFPAFAQQKADTTYTFRFVPQKDMFYVPWNGNDTELARLLECIENNKTTILDGKLPLLVDGYCNSLGSEAENLATAKIRANRVKSEHFGFVVQTIFLSFGLFSPSTHTVLFRLCFPPFDRGTACIFLEQPYKMAW